jgi:hypothetical protein
MNGVNILTNLFPCGIGVQLISNPVAQRRSENVHKWRSGRDNVTEKYQHCPW